MENPEYFSQPEIIWFIIGIVFLLLEFMIPGLIVMFFGVGAWVTSLVCLIFEPSLNVQLIVFLISSVFLLAILRRHVKKIFVGKLENNPDDILEEFIGKSARVEKAITKDLPGKVQFRGTQWEAVSRHNIKKGEWVKIISKESITLKVEPINKSAEE